jgi:hypothetical protein
VYPEDLVVAKTRLRELIHAAFELRGEPFSRETQVGRNQTGHRLSLTPHRLKAEEQEGQRGNHDRQQIQRNRPPVRKAAEASLGALATHGRDLLAIVRLVVTLEKAYQTRERPAPSTFVELWVGTTRQFSSPGDLAS